MPTCWLFDQKNNSMSKLVIAENPKKWTIHQEDVVVITPNEYFSDPLYQTSRYKVINLCRSYQYQTLGYYVSLLGEARKHKIIPKVSTLQEFRFPSIVRDETGGFEELIQNEFKSVKEKEIELNVYFGFTHDAEHNKIGILLFNLYQAPLLKAVFEKQKVWELQSLRPLQLNEIDDNERPTLNQALELYLKGRQVVRKSLSRKKYDLAIMVNPDDANPPSDAKALQKFIKAAGKEGLNAEIITKNDFAKLVQYDALLIRETTAVNNHTFRFAKKAVSEGLVVIDDPDSMLRCTNKVFLSELLKTHNIPSPKTVILQDSKLTDELRELKFPFILKEPDSAFSKGVKKVNNEMELKETLKDFFQKSDLVIAQEFIPTDYDWRVGVLDDEPIFVCKYFMARNHWQIMDWTKKVRKEGKTETIAVEDAPPKLIDIALRAAKAVGNGLYGVDVKEINNKFYIIEVNDNPNIDSGIEDKVLKLDLYRKIMATIVKRIKAS